jgi:hypothetical protein
MTRKSTKPVRKAEKHTTDNITRLPLVLTFGEKLWDMEWDSTVIEAAPIPAKRQEPAAVEKAKPVPAWSRIPLSILCCGALSIPSVPSLLSLARGSLSHTTLRKKIPKPDRRAASQSRVL